MRNDEKYARMARYQTIYIVIVVHVFARMLLVLFLSVFSSFQPLFLHKMAFLVSDFFMLLLADGCWLPLLTMSILYCWLLLIEEGDLTTL